MNWAVTSTASWLHSGTYAAHEHIPTIEVSHEQDNKQLLMLRREALLPPALSWS